MGGLIGKMIIALAKESKWGYIYSLIGKNMKFKALQEGELLSLINEKMGFNTTTKGRKLIKTGQVMVAGSVCRIPSKTILPGEAIEVLRTAPKKSSRAPGTLLYPVLFEDDAMLAFEKPAGTPTAAADRKIKTAFTHVQSWYRGKYPGADPLFFINKIDKRQSGLILLAKGNENRVLLAEEWDAMEKRYYAIVGGQPPKEKGKAKQQFVQNTIGLWKPVKGGNNKAVEATMEYRTMKASSEFTLLKIEGASEKKNLLRAQLAAMGMPVVGDDRYHAVMLQNWKRQGLHLFSISLKHPQNGKNLTIKTPVPKAFLQLIKQR